MATDLLGRVLALVASMEAGQAEKVIELARRIHPGLTAEDIRNPHDFPDLDDPDWHFEDGQLAGIQAVRFAIVTMSRELPADGDPEEARGGEAESAEDRAVLPTVLEDHDRGR